MVSAHRKKELAQEAKRLQPLLNVGKSGLSEGFVQELDLLLKKKGLVKVKFLRSFVDSNQVKEAAASLGTELNAELIDFVGNVAVFYRRPQQ